ncbi:Glycoprotein 3-alpha-L-fucosyltransferase A [Folsomia candida]|uniref:Fucosyltransferase n=2 Tax=Folsomia candida TaxID=158441 RepID=A0A226F4I3_FOLCA|nr:Glycoprotein 3-alpha-L-fucosyltransferase A [Folsomia candida]
MEKYGSLYPEHINDVLRILDITPNLWGYRGQKNLRNETISSRIHAQIEWIKQLAGTQFIKNVKRKKILVYLEPNPGDQYFFTGNKLKCPYAPEFEDKCDLVLENMGWRHLLKNHPSKSHYRKLGIDAVIGIRNGYWGQDTEFWNSEPTFPPNVQQIFYVFESPCHTASAQLGINNALLASYWRGADIPIPYRHFTKDATYHYNNNGESIEDINHEDVRKLAVALISNCVSVKNDRMGYIQQLRKYIPVDVFGQCRSTHQNTCPPGRDCLEYLGSQYKFYLAFENCNCEDYITEKLFVNGLQYKMVPVVMGAAPENYKSVAPPHSFIHVNDFASPQQLANYLKLLDKNETLFAKYGEWRQSQTRWHLTTALGADFFCRACALFYYGDFRPPPSYPSSSTRWADLNKCLPKNIWRWPD